MPEGLRRHLAAHVRAMISAAAQPKLADRAADRTRPFHLEAALGLAQPPGRPAPNRPPVPRLVTQQRAVATRAFAPHVAAAMASLAGTAGLQPRPHPGRAAVVQRSAQESSEMAEYINTSYSGEAESRNTQAVALYGGKKGTLFTQREYSSFDQAIVHVEKKYGIKIDDRVIADQKDDEGIHAEMLAVSWWLQGHTKKPTFLGVSQGVCARCEAVLTILGITYEPSGGHYTANWVHPYRHAGMTPKGKLAKLPQKVTKNKEYGWD